VKISHTVVLLKPVSTWAAGHRAGQRQGGHRHHHRDGHGNRLDGQRNDGGGEYGEQMALRPISALAPAGNTAIHRGSAPAAQRKPLLGRVMGKLEQI